MMRFWSPVGPAVGSQRMIGGRVRVARASPLTGNHRQRDTGRVLSRVADRLRRGDCSPCDVEIEFPPLD